MTQTKTATHRAGTPGNVRHSVDVARHLIRDIESAVFDVRAHSELIQGDALDRFSAEALSAAAALTHALETLRYSAGFEIFDPKTGERIEEETSADLWRRINALGTDPETLRDCIAAMVAGSIGAPDTEPEDSHGRLEILPPEPAEPITWQVVFPPFAGWNDVESDTRPVFVPDASPMPSVDHPRLEPMTGTDWGELAGWGLRCGSVLYRIDADALTGFEDGHRIIMGSSLKKPATAHPIG